MVGYSPSSFVINSLAKPDHKIELFSTEYFLYCTMGGIVACGPTHSFVTPLDFVKTRRQVFPDLYKSNLQAWKEIIRAEGGLGAVYMGIGATAIGYSFQGAGKYGLYEVFKKKYSDLVGEDTAKNYKTMLYLASSASAEFFADIALCPWEAIKVKQQTTLPPYAKTLGEGLSKALAAEGVAGLYKGIIPLWFRQIPYTMVKFSSFERVVEKIYDYLPKKKEQYSALSQTGVSFLGGYIAGIFCAVASHPADVMVSKVNAERKPGESMAVCMSRIYGKIGFVGLWNGLPARIVMIGTLTGMQWLLYDSFKLYFGLPTTGGH